MRLTAQRAKEIVAELNDISEELEVEDFEESIPDELKADEEFDLELDNANPMVAENEDDIETLEKEEEEEAEKDGDEDDATMTAEDDDPVVNVADIVKNADDDGNIKLSCIKALADETVIPDDKDDDAIASSKKGSVEKPGIEDKIGDEAGGGDPSVSKLKGIVSKIEDYANYCQKIGRRDLAYRLDVVANTLENDR